MKAAQIVLGLTMFSSVLSGSVITYTAVLNGNNESPATGSPGTGFASVIIDTTANTMQLAITFAGLEAGTTASHIHCCTTLPGTGTAGVATTTPFFAGFPTGVTSGSYTNTLDLTLASSYNPAFVTANTNIAGAEAALLNGLAAGEAYLNIHTTAFPGGEIRGFLVTPEPAAWPVLAAALGGLALLSRRRRS